MLICRQILFSPLSSLTDAVETVHLPPLIIMHHIIVLSPFRLPHEIHKWSQQEYFLWLQKHPDQREQWKLLEEAVQGQTKDVDDDTGYVAILQKVLHQARAQEQ